MMVLCGVHRDRNKACRPAFRHVLSGALVEADHVGQSTHQRAVHIRTIDIDLKQCSEEVINP